MMRRALVVGGVAGLLTGCPSDPSSPPVDTDATGTSTSGSSTGMESADDTGSTSEGSGSETGPADCEITPYPDDIVLGDGTAVSGDVARLVEVGDRLVACGDGFVEPVGGMPLAIEGICTGLVALDGTRGVAVTDAGSTVLFEVAGDAATELDVVLDAALRHEDVTVQDGVVYVASGTDGLRRFDVMADALGMATPVVGASDARGVASVPGALLLVADGPDGARLVDPTGDGSVAVLDLDPGVRAKQVARRVVVDGDRAFVLRGAFGVSVVELGEASLSLTTSVAVEGVSLDAVPVEGGALVATGSALVRVALDGGDPVVVSRQARPDRGELGGRWMRTVLSTAEGLQASAGPEVVAVTLGAGDPQPMMLQDRVTYSFWADEGESTETIATLENGGAVPMLVADLAADPFAVEPLNLEDRPGCPGQYVIPAAGRGLVQMTYEDPAAEVLLGSLMATTDTSDDAMFSWRVEANRAMAALGQPAPAFEVLTSEGDFIRATDYDQRVVFVKVFNET